MVIIKNQFEIEKIKKACKILAEVKTVLYDFIRPGVSLKEIDSVAFKEIRKGWKTSILRTIWFP
nr:hypothetical protein [Metamycoplasma hominis]